MDHREALQFTIEQAQKLGAEQCDVLYSSSAEEDLEVFKGEVSKAEASSSLGVGVRLFVNNCPGYAYSQKLHPESLTLMVSDAISHAKLSTPVHYELPSPQKSPDLDLKKWNPELEDLDMATMKEFALEADSFAWNLENKVSNVPHAGVNKSSSRSALMNHHGCFIEKQSNSVSGYIGVVTEKNEQKKSGSYGDGSRFWNDLNAKSIAEEAIQRSLELLGAKPIASGPCPVVFSNRISASILGMYLSNLSAEQVQRGQSKFVGQLGKKVASSIVELNCTPHIIHAPGSKIFDSEGVLCQNTPLIVNGVLENFIYNLESAAIDKVAPTGHGSRGLRGKASVSFSNLMMTKGSASLNDLLSHHPKCLYVTKLEGGAACSAISGELSIGVQGFLVENGNIVHPVDAITVNGNFFEFIQNISAVSNQVQETFSSYKIPDLLVEGLLISG
jgi:PmbA protein